VDPVPDPLLLGKSGSSRNRTRTSGSVARNSDHDHRGGYPKVITTTTTTTTTNNNNNNNNEVYMI
jgi:hypothetical protein